MFEQFGQQAEARYRDGAAGGSGFADLAAELLSEWDLPSVLSIARLHATAATGELAGIGDQSRPGLIPLYQGQSVRIVAHLWSDAADRLHQHDWSGAFQVIEGRSFNAEFAFDAADQLAEFTLGKISRTGFGIFRPGHIQPVQEGAALVHSVVYPGKPGLAVSLRAAGSGEKGAVEYLRPGLRCPSHRRRAASAQQVDLLAQALQVGEEAYSDLFSGFARQIDDAALIRLLDTAAFESLPVPEPVIDGLLEEKDWAGRVLASLADIERSDKTRELLGDHNHPVIRDFVCALFHSEGRSELAETLQAAGFEAPVINAGRALAALIVDDDEGALPPDHVVSALGEAALTGDVAGAVSAMRARAPDAEHLDQHCAFVAEAFEAMEEAPIFRSLFHA